MGIATGSLSASESSDMNYWRDKVAVVTGGSSGFGLALGAALVQAGAKVTLVARDGSRLQAAAASLRAGPGEVRTCTADITRDEDVARLFAEVRATHGRLDILVNNAGLSDRGEILTTPLARFRELWELNFLAALRCTQHAAPLLVPARGHLVFVGSLAAKSAARYLGAYSTSKFPLAALAQQLRLELWDSGVHVLLVCPGPLARPDAGQRYDARTAGLPETARRPGGGVKLKGLDPHRVAQHVLTACYRRRPELILPSKARWLFALSQVSANWGDWLLRRMT